MQSSLACVLVTGTAAHGVMYEPPIRISWGAPPYHPKIGPSCAAGSCLWINQGCTIGCPNCTGAGIVWVDKPLCSKGAEPTIAFEEKQYRTVGLRSMYKLNDFTKHHPWRFPGSAPVEDPCGLAGGWYTTSLLPWKAMNGGIAPNTVPYGTRGSTSSMVPKLLEQTVWIAGGETEVAWAIHANHGGGYQYRLCPAEEEPNEACFQRHPIDFVGDTQWLQEGYGMDVNNRTEIPAVTVPGDRVLPRGSTWRRTPIPPCNDDIADGALGTPCTTPNFEPAIPDMYGFGIGACDILLCLPASTGFSSDGTPNRLRRSGPAAAM